MLTLLLLASCEDARKPPTVTNDPAAVPTPGLDGVIGRYGTLLWSADPGVLEVSDGTGWRPAEVEAVFYAGGRAWSLSPNSDQMYRLVRRGVESSIVTPQPISIHLSQQPSHGLLMLDEVFSATVSLSNAPEHSALAVELFLDGAPLELDCLDGEAALTDCLSEAPVGLAADGLPVTLSGRCEREVLAEHTLTAELIAHGELIDVAEASFVALGHTLYWGDLHAHTNLSRDGCEDTTDCGYRNEIAGQDFFDNAAANDLDFAAITDHAEWMAYRANPDNPETTINIWEQQQALIANATTDVLPLLGYEWTYVAAGAQGGHKTVLLEEISSCDSRRIGAPKEGLSIRPDGSTYYSGNLFTAGSFGGLWSALGDGAESCEGAMRALTFAHHPALDPPQHTDWTRTDTTPNPSYEPVIEIYSEHGSSECLDLEVEGCDWGLKSNATYHGEGSVQMALLMGYRFGLVGGTDSHDSNPGSLSNSPSCTANWTDQDEDGLKETVLCHDHPGALTGIYSGYRFDQPAFFDAMFDRLTLATSGPRLQMRGLLTDLSGAHHLPGAAVPAGLARVRLGLEAEELDGLQLIEVALISADSTTLAWSDTLPLDAEVELLALDAAYIRLRLTDGEREERLWLSPWFAD